MKIPSLSIAEKEVDRWWKERDQMLLKCEEAADFSEVENINKIAHEIEEKAYIKSANNGMILTSTQDTLI